MSRLQRKAVSLVHMLPSETRLIFPEKGAEYEVTAKTSDGVDLTSVTPTHSQTSWHPRNTSDMLSVWIQTAEKERVPVLDHICRTLLTMPIRH